MRDILTQYGFTFEGTCQCDGHHTEKYKKGEFQVRVRSRSSQFKIKYGGRSMTQWVPAHRLSESLQNVVKNIAAPFMN